MLSREESRDWPASRGCGIVGCAKGLQIYFANYPARNFTTCLCVRGAALIMITQRQGGRVTLVLLTLKGASFDHHENHLRPQYNLSVFCHMNKKHAGLRLRLFTQTRMAQDVHCQYLATIVETEIWNRECRAEFAANAQPVQSRTLQICRCLVTFYPSQYFARTKISAWSSAAWHKHSAAGRLIYLQRMGGFYWYYYLLLEPQMTCFCSPRI